MGSSAKTGKKFFEGHRSTFCIKVPFGIGHSYLHIKCSLYVCSRVQGSQIFKRNSIILFHSKVIVILPIWVSSARGGGGRWVGVSRVKTTIIYMSSGVLKFGVLGSLRLWGWGVGWMGVGGGWGAPHTCTCTHMHACAHTHIYMLNMIISIANGHPHWGNPWEFPMMSYACAHVCMCMCVHARACMHVCAYACVCGAPSHHLIPTPRGTPRISQNSIALELIEIFQFCLKICNLWRLPHPWVVV